jgi:hypothetical protein
MPAPILLWRDAPEGGTAPHHLKPVPSAGDEMVSGASGCTGRAQQFMRELLLAWRHRALPATAALYSAPTHTDDLSVVDGTTCSCIVVLLRPPTVLRARVTMHGTGAAAAEAQMSTIVPALAEALQPWLTPLSLSLDFVEPAQPAQAARSAATGVAMGTQHGVRSSGGAVHAPAPLLP